MSTPAVAGWRRSTFSNSNNNCVEAAFVDGGHVVLRDSKNPSGHALLFNRAEWDAFLEGVHNGEFTWRTRAIAKPPWFRRWLPRARRGRTRPAGPPDARSSSTAMGAQWGTSL
jgi:hypothetical protein